MTIEINQTGNKCNYPYCEKQDHGKCIDEKNHADCVEFALAVLCAKEKKEDA